VQIRKANIIHSVKHQKFVASFPCVVCGNDTQVQACHIRSIPKVGNVGKGVRDCRFLIPMCFQHHTEQHLIGELQFFGKYNINPTTLYSNLVTNLKNSISSGNFALFLQSESVLLNSSLMLNVIVSNYTISQMTVLNQTNIPTAIPTNIPTAIKDSKITDNLSQKKILIIILVSIGVFILIISVFLYVLYKVNRSSNIKINIRSINNNINSINTENIVISINHNE
jgi:hypothetical protein